MQEAPVFHLNPQGRLGNLMIQYMVALKFASLVPGCRISNIDLPLWGIHHPPIDSPGPVELAQRNQHIDLKGLARRVLQGEIRRVEWLGYGQRLENLLPVDHYRAVFRPPADLRVGFGPDYLVCPVRAEELLEVPHEGYPLTPVAFYEELVARTGLQPVFIGQTEPNTYTRLLRERFPQAIIRERRDVLVDFETIRQSCNIAVGVSSFVWVAAWLSQAENIFMTVNGLFNPRQDRSVDLLPFGDARFHFWLFPINHAVPDPHWLPLHRRLQPYWRFLPQDVLQRLLAEAPRFTASLEDMLAVYDEAYYLEANRDVGPAIAKGYVSTGLEHYRGWGYREARRCFRLEPSWYAAEYPLAGLEVAQGDYLDLHHHYAAIGRRRGYRPVPS